MTPYSEVALVWKVLVLLVGLTVPGAMWMRALRLPATLGTSFAGSALALYVTVVVLQLSGVPIAFGSLACGLAALTLLARLVQAGTDGESVPPFSLLTRSRNYNPLTGMGGWTPLYVLFWAAVLWRAAHEPLAGPDVEFRWSFLAEQMLRTGSLDFYPPRSADDFYSYFWVESLPPGASALHAWAYACAGSSNAAWTIPAVVFQVWSVHEVLWRVAERFGGVLAARFACLCAAACPLLTWSILIGQETGLTTLSLLGIAMSIQVWSETRDRGWAALAGIFAALGASAREYGLIFPVIAAGAVVAARANWRAWVAFLPFAIIGVVWPARTWLLTGNPFYSLSVPGNLPVNERFVAWVEHEARTLGTVLHSFAGWRDITRYLVLYAPAALVGWIVVLAGTLRGHRHSALGLAAIAAMLALWAMSVRYTNGGLFYSLRVASPALALGILAAGIGAASYISSRARTAFVTKGILALLALALIAVTLALPRNPWRTPPAEWPAIAAPAVPPVGRADETVALITKAMSATTSNTPVVTGVVLADAPGFQRRFLPTGIHVIPLWSPQADWLFDSTLSPPEAVRRWRQSNVSHIVITKWQPNFEFFNTRSRWSRPPFQVHLVGETKLTAVFSIRAVE